MRGKGVGKEPNHMTARKPDPKYIIQYSLTLYSTLLYNTPLILPFPQLLPAVIHTESDTDSCGFFLGFLAFALFSTFVRRGILCG
jgi:hypothetical protein